MHLCLIDGHIKGLTCSENISCIYIRVQKCGTGSEAVYIKNVIF